MNFLGEYNSSEIKIEINKGKYHQSKYMFDAVEIKVVELEWISMGKLKLLNDLKHWQYVEFGVDEIK